MRKLSAESWWGHWLENKWFDWGGNGQMGPESAHWEKCQIENKDDDYQSDSTGRRLIREIPIHWQE